jgi:hypothetical protein
VVNELKQLMGENVAAPPSDDLDIAALVERGRRRVRRRRAGIVSGVALAAVAVATGAAFTLPSGGSHRAAADRPPRPDAPTVSLAGAEQAVEGRDYRVLATHTNDDLEQDNGQYLDGVTEDGLILFRDGPRSDLPRARLGLMDPVSGATDWLPPGPGAQSQTWPIELGTDRLVLAGAGRPSEGGMETRLQAYVFDRATRRWTTVSWPTLPAVDQPYALPGPDGRLYVRAPAERGAIPPGGWPTGAHGEAEDADAEGDTYHLWSVSPTDGADVRDEHLTVGSIAFTQGSMVWTDSTNGDAGQVHVRDLATGEEHSFDPHTGERCNLLSFGASGDRVVMSQYCGTYDDGVRDDRVQILTTDGDQVVTVQDTGIDGAVAGSGGAGDVVSITAYEGSAAGTYVYDLDTDRFLRVSDAVSSYGTGGQVLDGQFSWQTPVNHHRGATQWLGALLR